MSAKTILLLLVAGMATVLVYRTCANAPEPPPPFEVTSLAFVDTGAEATDAHALGVLAGCSDGILRWWPRAGRSATVLRGHTGEVTGVAADLDGRAWSAGRDGRLLQWHLGEGRAVQEAATGAPIALLAVVPDLDVVATASPAGEIVVREPIGLGERWRIATGMTEPTAIALSTDARLVAIANVTGFRVYAWRDDAEETPGTVPSGSGALCFVPRQAEVWVGGTTKPAHLHVAVDGNHVRSLGERIESPTRTILATPEGDMVLTGDGVGHVVGWSVDTGRKTFSFEMDHPIRALALRSDHRMAAAASGDRVRIFDPDNGDRLDDL